MSSRPAKILLTGATGFVGGTVLDTILSSESSVLREATITCLVRGADRAATLQSHYNDRIRTAVYKDLDDLETTTKVAAGHDIVISTTLGYHLPSAQALLRGLARRKVSTGKDVWMIHLSGTSNISDQPITGPWVEDREFDDVEDDIYGWEKERELKSPYIQRQTELGVILTGLGFGVKTGVMMAPTIFGLGKGLFNKISVQIPTYIRTALDYGRAVVIGEGDGERDYVHVEDLADLYTIMLLEILEGGGMRLPTGKKGIMFSGSGRFTWREVAQNAADVCFAGGTITDRTVESVSLKEGTKLLASYLGGVNEAMVEVGLSARGRTVASLARRLGWMPTRTGHAWKQGFEDDLKVVLESRSREAHSYVG